MKRDYHISKQFQDDLIKAYNKVAQHSWTQEEAYRKAVKLPAPRFYVSAKQAAQIIAPMVRGDFTRVDLMRPIKRRMYYAIFDRVVELSEKRAFIGKSLFYIVQYAVLSPAPEFFVTPRSLEQVRSFLKNGYYDLTGKVTSELPCRKKAYEKLKRKRAELRAYREKMRALKNLTPSEGLSHS